MDMLAAVLDMPTIHVYINQENERVCERNMWKAALNFFIQMNFLNSLKTKKFNSNNTIQHFTDTFNNINEYFKYILISLVREHPFNLKEGGGLWFFWGETFSVGKFD